MTISTAYLNFSKQDVRDTAQYCYKVEYVPGFPQIVLDAIEERIRAKMGETEFVTVILQNQSLKTMF